MEKQGWRIPEFLKDIEAVDSYQSLRAKKAADAARAMGIMSIKNPDQDPSAIKEGNRVLTSSTRTSSKNSLR